MLILIGGDGCGLTSSTTLDGTAATATTATAASSGGGFAATGRGGGFAAATSAGLALTGFRHYIYIIILLLLCNKYFTFIDENKSKMLLTGFEPVTVGT